MEITKGKIVKHITTGECFTVKKINGNVAVLNVENPSFGNGILSGVLIDVKICLVDNLILV